MTEWIARELLQLPSGFKIMLGGIRAIVSTFAQTVVDVAYSGAEATQIKWEEQTLNWEDIEG